MYSAPTGKNGDWQMVQGLRVAGSILNFLGFLGSIIGAVLTVLEVLN